MLGILFAFTGSAASRGEYTPPVEQVARRAVLIVKCRTEIKDGLVNYRVLEAWKGKYSPDLLYVKPLEGYRFAYGFDVKGTSGVKDGQEAVFIYSDSTVSRHSDNRGQDPRPQSRQPLAC